MVHAITTRTEPVIPADELRRRRREIRDQLLLERERFDRAQERYRRISLRLLAEAWQIDKLLAERRG